MMYRTLLSCAAIIAVASAQTITADENGDIVVNVPKGKTFITSRTETIDVSGMHYSLENIEDKKSTKATKVDALKSAQEYSMNAAGRVLNKSNEMINSMKDFRISFRKSVADGIKNVKSKLFQSSNNTHSEAHAKLAKFINGANANFSKFTNKIQKLLSDVEGHANTGFACGRNGQGYDAKGKKCVVPNTLQLGNMRSTGCSSNQKGGISFEAAKTSVRACDGSKNSKILSAKDVYPTVAHRHWNNNDGRDSGWISNRVLKFTKTDDDTYLQIIYYDNMRVHGNHWCQGDWEVYICDQNNNNCGRCTDPGRVFMHKYSHQQHNQWMNDHYAHDVHGICRRTDKKSKLTAGTYHLRAYLHHRRCDLYTGHNGQVGSFQVTEVVKA